MCGRLCMSSSLCVCACARFAFSKSAEFIFLFVCLRGQVATYGSNLHLLLMVSVILVS